MSNNESDLCIFIVLFYNLFNSFVIERTDQILVFKE